MDFDINLVRYLSSPYLQIEKNIKLGKSSRIELDIPNLIFNFKFGFNCCLTGCILIAIFLPSFAGCIILESKIKSRKKCVIRSNNKYCF